MTIMNAHISVLTNQVAKTLGLVMLLVLSVCIAPLGFTQGLPTGFGGLQTAPGPGQAASNQAGMPAGVGAPGLMNNQSGTPLGSPQSQPFGGSFGGTLSGNRLLCPPGTQGISCFDASGSALLARQAGSMNAAGDLQRGLQQRALTDEPTQFQRHIERLTGRWLPIFGLNFFSDALLMRTDGLRVLGGDVANPTDYSLGVGDEVIVNLWGQVESSLSLLVDPQGQITLPRVGPVMVAGLRLNQLEPLLKEQFSKTFSNFRLSVRVGQLKSIQVYVVGHVRQPGAYVLSSQATALAALQLAGGPTASGSLRRVSLKRAGKVVASLDLYRLITQGDASGNVRLMQGDSLLVPPAGPRVALSGQTDLAGIYELTEDEQLSSILSIAGVSLGAPGQHLVLERMEADGEPFATLAMRSIRLQPSSPEVRLRDGDVISVQRAQAAFSQTVTLRGHVARPFRYAYRAGLRVKDLLPDVSALVTADFHERRNSLVQYEGAIATGRLGQTGPLSDLRQTNDPRLLVDGVLPPNLASAPLSSAGVGPAGHGGVVGGAAGGMVAGSGASSLGGPPISGSNAQLGLTASISRDVIPGTPYGIDPSRRLPGQRPPSEVRNLLDQIHWDYAVIERISPKDLTLSLLPFDLGKLMLEGDERHNLALEAGDVITIFGKSDLRIPLHRQERVIRVEGEVGAPGFYLAGEDDDLQSILQKAGGLSARAYIFGLRLTRESVRQEQRENLVRLIKNLQDSQANVLTQAAVTVRSGDGASSALSGEAIQQLRLQQQRVIERLVRLEPEGRIALGLSANDTQLANLPRMRLEHGDRIVVPAKPSAISVQGASFSENPMLWREGQRAADVIRQSGTPAYADIANGFVLRADGSTVAFGAVPAEDLALMPGDTIVIPEIADRRSNFWKGMDLARAWTTVFSQIGISLVAIKTLFNN